MRKKELCYRYNPQCASFRKNYLFSLFIRMQVDLMGVWHEILDFSFFHESVYPGYLSFPFGPFRLFMKICGDIRNFVFTTVSCDTGYKLFTGVN